MAFANTVFDENSQRSQKNNQFVVLGHLKRAISIFENQKMFVLVLDLFDRKHDDPYFCYSILKDFHG
jgi:hypothetical protein